jgi:hypothetical protein
MMGPYLAPVKCLESLMLSVLGTTGLASVSLRELAFVQLQPAVQSRQVQAAYTSERLIKACYSGSVVSDSGVCRQQTVHMHACLLAGAVTAACGMVSRSSWLLAGCGNDCCNSVVVELRSGPMLAASTQSVHSGQWDEGKSVCAGVCGCGTCC